MLGAAKTGSGKTLAFLVPVVERLFRERWGDGDGVGALVISPTRELALQIFDVLRGLAGRHDVLTAALITGGKDFGSEQDHVHRMNILVCTPGRLLQHFEQTPGFHCEDLKILVLDEADRILDMGFEQELNQILSHLPPSGGGGEGMFGRQTLLFSATQTKSVKQLARLSLTKPEFVSVHEQARFATPERLKQHLAEVELADKLDVVYSFIRTHLRQKIIVFFSSCKQVRFVYEGLRRMRPGVPLMALHGKVKPARRNFVYRSYVEKKNGTGCVLFATDIAARGLDFPGVDWVIQADCPEDVATYIHRVGRTARFKRGGRSLLLLTPSESHFQVLLEKAKIPVQKIAINPDKLASTSTRVQFGAHAAQDADFKYLAQKAFISYMRSVYLRKNKLVFNIHKLPAEEFAASMGLPSMPQIKILSQAEGHVNYDSSDDDESQVGVTKKKNKNKKLERLRAKIKAEKQKKREEALKTAVAAASAKEAARSMGKAKAKLAQRRSNASESPSGSSSSGSSSDSSSDSSSSDSSSSDDSSDEEEDTVIKPNSVIDQLRRRKNPGVLSEARQKIRSTDPDGERGVEGVLVLKRRIGADDAEDEDDDESMRLALEKNKRPRKKIRTDGSGHGKNVRKVFDEDGNAMLPFELIASGDSSSVVGGQVDLHEATSAHMKALAARLAAADKEDKKSNRARIKEKRIKQKEKAKAEARDGNEEDEAGAVLQYRLGSASDSTSGSDSDSSGSSDSSSASDDDNDNQSDDRQAHSSSALSGLSEAEKAKLLEKMLSR